VFLLVGLYVALAFCRERAAVAYYRCITHHLATWAAVLNFTIGMLDGTALVFVFAKLMQGWGPGRALALLMIYEVGGSLGTFFGVRRNKRNTQK